MKKVLANERIRLLSILMTVILMPATLFGCSKVTNQYQITPQKFLTR